MKNRVIGRWSVRESYTIQGSAYMIYPKGERSHWSVKATLYPATDGKCFVITVNNGRLDARPSLDEAIARAIEVLDMGRKSNV
jgi:hypothetical protein